MTKIYTNTSICIICHIYWSVAVKNKVYGQKSKIKYLLMTDGVKRSLCQLWNLHIVSII